jgi:DNA invertase Pin-like site-specific DNA recombinase
MKAIKLIRVSTPGQAADDRWGIARQEDQCAAGERAHQLDVVRIAKVQESGKFILEDADFQGIVRDLEAGLADGILVAEQSRLVRPETFDLFAVFGLFQKLRKMIWTPTAAIDPATPEGAMLLGVSGLMDGLELGKMKARMHGARESLRKAGFSGCGGHALPRGVLYAKRKGQRGGVWSYDPDYNPRVKEAFRLLVEEDASYERIAVTLDSSERGAQLCLENPIWTGYRRRKIERLTAPVRMVEKRRTSLKEGEKVRRYRPARPLAEPEDVATNLVSEPLISRELYAQAQRIMASRRSRYKKNKRSANTLVPGPMIRCACGDGHYHKGDKRGYDRLYCASRHPAKKRRTKASRHQDRPSACTAASFRRDDFYRAIDEMFAQALTAKFLFEILGEAQQAGKQAPAKARAIDADLAALDTALAKGLRQYMLGKVSEAIWLEIREELEAKRQVLLADRPGNLVMYDAAVFAKKIAAVFAEYGQLLPAQKRELLHRAVKEIHVSRHAEILSIRLSGGFLSGLEGWAKSGKRSQTSSQFSPQDLTIQFPVPIKVRAAA